MTEILTAILPEQTTGKPVILAVDGVEICCIQDYIPAKTCVVAVEVQLNSVNVVRSCRNADWAFWEGPSQRQALKCICSVQHAAP